MRLGGRTVSLEFTVRLCDKYNYSMGWHYLYPCLLVLNLLRVILLWRVGFIVQAIIIHSINIYIHDAELSSRGSPGNSQDSMPEILTPLAQHPFLFGTN